MKSKETKKRKDLLLVNLFGQRDRKFYHAEAEVRKM